MTSSTVIAQLHLTAFEKRQRDGTEQDPHRARKRRRRGRRRSRGSLGGSPPGAGGRLLRL
ncbi:MAG: hypothetical protein EDQ89_12880 [Acidobacteria bacterium]|nr:MAG: hypothetical protein EDQ89_12880 [Acidobacteriota bacterium]MCL4286929.1 hypothetical protein [Thermoleophilia bacterium]